MLFWNSGFAAIHGHLSVNLKLPIMSVCVRFAVYFPACLPAWLASLYVAFLCYEVQHTFNFCFLLCFATKWIGKSDMFYKKNKTKNAVQSLNNELWCRNNYGIHISHHLHNNIGVNSGDRWALTTLKIHKMSAQQLVLLPFPSFSSVSFSFRFVHIYRLFIRAKRT